MSTISLRQLRYLAAIAQHEHFGRAAAACSVTQPALSMQIKELERELKVVLIERRRQGMQLTEEGREVARRPASSPTCATWSTTHHLAVRCRVRCIWA
jgi:LysR family hydrogen peroxide-inducible transcriptional activator